jgi:nitrogen fixation/metabolism regulation signal transduction histidine kinase
MILADADETIREYLEMIADEVGNATKIVSDVLDFARTRPADRGQVAVSSLLATVLEKHPLPRQRCR